jgi:class 3 adenylate cyclase
MEVPEVRFTTSGGSRIAWQQWGSGPDLLMIPPVISNVELLWEQELYRRAYEYYGEHLRVTTFDKRGVGLSDRFVDPPTFEQRVEDILTVMDAAGLARPNVQGTSEGGQMAQLFTLAHPDRVDRLVLTNSNPGAAAFHALHVDADGSEERYAEMVRKYARLIETWGTDPQYFVDWYNPGQSANPAFVRWMGRYCRQSVTASDLWQQLLSIAEMDAGPRLGEITAPTLVTHHLDDGVIPVGAGRFLASHIPEATLRELEGSDHFGLAYPGWRDLADIQIEFLTGTRPERRPDRRLASVLFTDIVGSTTRTVVAGDGEWRRTLDAHDRIAWDTANRQHGTLVKNTGDGLLLRFESPVDALAFAEELRRRLAEIGLSIRCGVHMGEIEVRADGDIAGVAVNLAARVEQAAADGAIFVSSTVRDLLLGSDTRFDDRGEHSLKGFDSPWRLYSLVT